MAESEDDFSLDLDLSRSAISFYAVSVRPCTYFGLIVKDFSGHKSIMC